ncbi:MAG: protein kinase, partial [Candidatus Hodarchaeota archaeon]
MDEKLPDNQRVLELLFQLGNAHLEKGQYEKAIEKFRKLIELGEENATIYLNLSKAYIFKEQYDESAVQVFLKALKYDPENKVINIVLSQIYFNNNKEDNEAYKVYQKALQYHPKNSKDLILALIKIDYKNGRYKSAKSLAQKTLASNPDYTEIIPYYTYLGWKEEAFDEVTKTLKEILLKKRCNLALKWLVLNYLKALKNAAINKKEYKIVHDDVQYCENYLNSVNQFNQLNDIYLFLYLKRIVLDFTSGNIKEKNQSIDEYELFLSDNSLSTIWNRALNKEDLIEIPFNFSKEVWKRIVSLNNSPSNMSTIDNKENKINTDAEFNHIDTLTLIQIANYDELIQKPNDKDLFIKFDSFINSTLDQNSMSSLKRMSDGYFILGNDTVKAISNAIDILRGSHKLHAELKNGTKLEFQIIIHHLTSKNSNDLLNDLNILFEIQQLYSGIFYSKNPDSVNGKDPGSRICVTETVYNILKNDNYYKSKLLETISMPNLLRSIPIYEIVWEDSLDNIRNGIVKKINRYHILNEIYLNDAFDSFKAIDTFLDRLVILKVLRPDFPVSEQPELSKVFQKQAHLIGKLNHNNIANIYDINEDEGFCYIVREFVEGMQLKTQLTGSNKIDWRKAIEFCQNICNALSYAHKTGIIHRRIKPSNIFFSESEEIKITDFSIPGFSTTIKNNRNLNLIGISYASPEQIADKNIDHRTDIYSLGVVLYELLTKENPFYDDDREKLFNNIITIDPPSVSSKNNDIPTEID